MKTKEFIRRVEDELGYVTEKSENYITIRKEQGKFDKLFAMVAMNEVLGIDTSFHNFTSLDKHDRNLLFDLILKYSKTPLEEREEEKRYYIKLKNYVLAHTMTGDYLNFRNDNHISEGESYMFSSKDSKRFYNTEFTQKEIDNFPDDVKEVLPLCEKIEVTP